MNDYTGIADLYDVYVTEAADLPFWSRCAMRTSGPILELAAGTGRVTEALRAASAAPLVAMDRAPAMLRRLLDRLRERSGGARAVGADLTALPFRAERFGLAVIPFNSLAEVVDADRRAGVFAELRRVLRAGGRAVVTLHDPAYRRRALDGETRRLGPYRAGDRSLEVLVRGRLLAADLAESDQTYRIRDVTGRLLEERQLTLRFALPDAASLAAMARTAELTVTAVYGDYDESPYREGSSRYIVAVLSRAP
jgi:SAM-dependent methyltransferase